MSYYNKNNVWFILDYRQAGIIVLGSSLFERKNIYGYFINVKLHNNLKVKSYSYRYVDIQRIFEHL